MQTSNFPKNMINLYEVRKEKAAAEFFARGRKPLYVSHARGKIVGQTTSQDSKPFLAPTFANQLNRLQEGLAQVEALLQGSSRR